MNRTILRLAVPNVISNITIPMLGIVDIAVAGRMGDLHSVGAIAVGTTIFNFIYWNCAFLRMGTSGMTAQAYGAGNKSECANLLLRSLGVALVIALLLLVLQRPLGRLSLRAMGASAVVSDLAAQYFFARIWAVPAAISLFAMHGWFIGMQDSTTPMIVSIFTNLVNIGCCLLFVFRLDMGIAGMGYAAVVAQCGGLVLSWAVWLVRYGEYARLFSLRESFRKERLIGFFHVNKDVFLRTLCVVTAYTFFTSASAQWGDTVLAANAVLMQLFTLFSYMSDGFGYAAESLTGRYVGARDQASLRRCIKALMWWAMGIAVLFVGIYIADWRGIVNLFTPDSAIVECVGNYVGWVIAVPLLSFFPFLIDGIMLGATQTKILRNTVFISLAAYFVVYFSLRNVVGNNSIWLAFMVFTVMRGVLLYFATGRLDVKKIMRQES